MLKSLIIDRFCLFLSSIQTESYGEFSFVSGIFGPVLFVGQIRVTVCNYRLFVLLVGCSTVSIDH